MWREVVDLRRQVAMQEEQMGGPGASAATGRTVGEVDEELEREERDREDHERKRDDIARRQVGASRSKLTCSVVWLALGDQVDWEILWS